MNYYEILGVATTSEPEVIEAAYRTLMKKYHPDRQRGNHIGANRRASELNEAYHVLSNPQRRQSYDCEMGKRPTIKQNEEGNKVEVSKGTNNSESAGIFSEILSPGPEIGPFYRPKKGLMILAGIIAPTLAIFYISTTYSSPSSAQPTDKSPEIPAKLIGNRLSVFCITNNTLNSVTYRVKWDGDIAESYELRPGYQKLHSYPYASNAVVSFSDNESNLGVSVNYVPVELLQSVKVNSIQSSTPASCVSKYVFEYKDLLQDGEQRSRYSRFGLYQSQN